MEMEGSVVSATDNSKQTDCVTHHVSTQEHPADTDNGIQNDQTLEMCKTVVSETPSEQLDHIENATSLITNVADSVAINRDFKTVPAEESEKFLAISSSQSGGSAVTPIVTSEIKDNPDIIVDGRPTVTPEEEVGKVQLRFQEEVVVKQDVPQMSTDTVIPAELDKSWTCKHSENNPNVPQRDPLDQDHEFNAVKHTVAEGQSSDSADLEENASSVIHQVNSELAYSENHSKSLFSNSSSTVDESEPAFKQRKIEQPQECSQETANSEKIEQPQECSQETANSDAVEMPVSDISCSGKMLYNFKQTPKQITGAWSCFETHDQGNYLRGCKWAPDGTCLLTTSNDNYLRLFNLPQELYYDGGENQDIQELMPVVKMKEADTIYDFCWYPKMSSHDADTACLAVTSKETPIHMFDAFTGELRCSYRPHNQVDELAAAYSLSFDPDGQKLYCGFNKMIRVFDVNRPGKECQSRPTYAKEGQPGIISCISHSPTEHGVYAAGSYARGIAVYSEPSGEMICMFLGQQGGVTQLMFSADGYRLYSGGRKDPEIICWDMRNPGQILYTMLRQVETNQRIYFDQTSDGRYMMSGSHNGTVIVWDTQQQPVMVQADTDPLLQPTLVYPAHRDTVNGVSFHPLLPLIASCSGQRHFPLVADSDSESDQAETTDTIDNSVRLWWV